MSEKWYHHFSVIMFMKDYITKNQEEVYQKIYSIHDYISEITHETYRHEVLHGLILYIMYMCKVEFTAQLFQYVAFYRVYKEFYQTCTKQSN